MSLLPVGEATPIPENVAETIIVFPESCFPKKIEILIGDSLRHMLIPYFDKSAWKGSYKHFEFSIYMFSRDLEHEILKPRHEIIIEVCRISGNTVLFRQFFDQVKKHLQEVCLNFDSNIDVFQFMPNKAESKKIDCMLELKEEFDWIVRAYERNNYNAFIQNAIVKLCEHAREIGPKGVAFIKKPLKLRGWEYTVKSF